MFIQYKIKGRFIYIGVSGHSTPHAPLIGHVGYWRPRDQSRGVVVRPRDQSRGVFHRESEILENLAEQGSVGVEGLRS